MVTIKKPSKKDFKSLENIYNLAFAPFTAIQSKNENKALKQDRVTASSLEESSKSRIILCAENEQGVILGFILFRRKNKNVVWIHSLFVSPEYQRQGIGMQLLKSCEKFARKTKCKLVALETHAKAMWAINFYLNNGFVLANKQIREYPYNLILDKPPVRNRPIFAKIL